MENMPPMPPQRNLPKKACLLQLMFAIESDTDALAVKQVIDDAIKDVKEKRFTFQIIES